MDENDSTQDKLAKAVAQHFGIKYGFHGAIAALVAQFSIMDFSEAIEDVNEQVRRLAVLKGRGVLIVDLQRGR